MLDHGQLLKNNRFQVYIGQRKLSFAKISGLGVDVEKEVYSEGGANGAPHVMFVPKSQTRSITLERGVQADDKTIKNMRPGTYIPLIEIIVMGADGQPSYGYYLEDSYVTRWEIQDLDAADGRILIDVFGLDYLSIHREYLR